MLLELLELLLVIIPCEEFLYFFWKFVEGHTLV